MKLLIDIFDFAFMATYFIFYSDPRDFPQNLIISYGYPDKIIDDFRWLRMFLSGMFFVLNS